MSELSGRDALTGYFDGATIDMDQPLYRGILRRAGFVLVAIGLVDIGWMIYCVVNGISYSSSLNIFAVIAGVLLIRGGLRTAGITLEQKEPRGDVWVIEPKMLPGLIEKAPIMIAPSDVALAAFHLSRYVRSEAEKAA